MFLYFLLDIVAVNMYNNNMNESNEKYSWHPVKRQENITKHRLDFVLLADLVFEDPDLNIFDDTKPNKDNEQRRLAYALVDGTRLCLCFTHREDKIHLISLFKMHDKPWRKRYEKK